MSLIKKSDGVKKFQGKKKSRKFNAKKLQYGGLSVALTIVFIAVIMLANAGVTYLTKEYSLKADISVAGLYQISEQTETMLKNLTDPVKCYILKGEAEIQESTYYSVSAELLSRYENLSDGMFQVEYIDIYKNPSFINQYETAEGLSSGDFIIESEKRYRVCSLYDLYEISNTYDDDGNVETSYVSGFKADEQFATMLHYVTTGQLPTVGYITGHGEVYSDSLKEIYDENNYESYEINLMMEDIPNGTDMLVISAPYYDYTEEEIEKLDKYFVDEFGKAMVFMAPDASEMPNLEAYFEEWGVRFGTAQVMDSARTLNYYPMVVPYIQSTDMTEDTGYTASSMVCMPYSRPIEILWEERSSRSVTAQLVTGNTSYSKEYSDTDKAIDTFMKEDGDANGPFTLCAMAEYWQWINNRSYFAQILFFGTSAMADDSLMGTSALYNKQFMTNAISYLTPTSEAISLTARDLTSSDMAILSEQATGVLIALVVVIPILVLVLGVVVWLKRRNK